MKRAMIGLEFYGTEQFPAYQQGYTWNGWLVPAFTVDVMDQLMVVHDKAMKELSDFPVPSASYDAATDTYTFPGPYEEDDEQVKGEWCETEDGLIKLYPLGAANWCWE